jgi:hypothetical protein
MDNLKKEVGDDFIKYIISFRFLDDRVEELELGPDDMEAFMAAFSKNKAYFNLQSGAGIWVPLDKVRSFYVERVDKDGNRVRREKKEELCQ